MKCFAQRIHSHHAYGMWVRRNVFVFILVLLWDSWTYLGVAPRNRRCQVVPTIRSGRPSYYLTSIHQMAPPKRGGTHL